uniref:BMERB domain-containing protein n=1 Tax=Megaselia scalaris TaxID=36166 RepID=T1GYN5_MEGSC
MILITFLRSAPIIDCLETMEMLSRREKKASDLEKKLRAVMGGNSSNKETEEQLLAQWFTLINKRMLFCGGKCVNVPDLQATK